MLARLMVPDRRSETEWLDDPDSIASDLSGNLRDIRRLNHYLGETRIVLAHLQRILPRGSSTLLDVATGSADIPLRACHEAAARGKHLDVTGLDCSREVLAQARAHAADAVTLVTGDARELPFDAASFDVVTSSLSLHHFEPEDAIRVLGEMWRVARHAIIVVDLTRSYPAYVGTWLATHLIARNAVTRHDGPLSVLRSYTPAEMLGLAEAAGIDAPQITVHPLFRQSVWAIKETGHD